MQSCRCADIAQQRADIIR